MPICKGWGKVTEKAKLQGQARKKIYHKSQSKAKRSTRDEWAVAAAKRENKEQTGNDEKPEAGAVRPVLRAERQKTCTAHASSSTMYGGCEHAGANRSWGIDRTLLLLEIAT